MGEVHRLAKVAAPGNEPDAAFEWLERAYAQHDGGLPLTNQDPLLKSLHNDPRYAAFLDKIHLPNLTHGARVDSD